MLSPCNNTSCITADTVSCSLSVAFTIVHIIALVVLVFFKMYHKFIYLMLMTSHWELKYCVQVWYMAYQPAFRYGIISYLATSCKEFIVFYIVLKWITTWRIQKETVCSYVFARFPTGVRTAQSGFDGNVSMFCLLYLGWRHLLKTFSNSHLFLPAQTQPPPLSIQLQNAVTCATLGH